MHNNSLAELAFELLRIHLGRHDIQPEIEPLNSAITDDLVATSGCVPLLTEHGTDAINRIVNALFEGMEGT